MSDYFDRVERQLVERVDTVHAPVAPPSELDRLRDAIAIGDHPGADPLTCRRRVADRTRPRPRPTRALRSSLVGAGLGGLGGLIAAIIMSLGASTPIPDLLVARAKGGLVTIAATSASSIPALNARLASLGIAVRTAPVRPGCVAPVQTAGGRHRPRIARTLVLGSLPVLSRRRSHPDAMQFSATVAAPTAPGRVLVVAAGGPGSETVGELVRGSAPVCIRSGRGSDAALIATG